MTVFFFTQDVSDWRPVLRQTSEALWLDQLIEFWQASQTVRKLAEEGIESKITVKSSRGRPSQGGRIAFDFVKKDGDCLTVNFFLIKGIGLNGRHMNRYGWCRDNQSAFNMLKFAELMSEHAYEIILSLETRRNKGD